MRTEPGVPAFINRFLSISSAFAAILGFLVVIPLTLWFAWTRRSRSAEAMPVTLLSISSAWMLVSVLGWSRSFRALGNGPSSAALLLGPRPEARDQLRAWKWGRHIRYALLAVLLSMIGIGTTLWLNGN
jgi:hypothetical protein